jgi:uncharacterized small protein (DUF1192 family)
MDELKKKLLSPMTESLNKVLNMLTDLWGQLVGVANACALIDKRLAILQEQVDRQQTQLDQLTNTVKSLMTATSIDPMQFNKASQSSIFAEEYTALQKSMSAHNEQLVQAAMQENLERFKAEQQRLLAMKEEEIKALKKQVNETTKRPASPLEKITEPPVLNHKSSKPKWKVLDMWPSTPRK